MILSIWRSLQVRKEKISFISMDHLKLLTPMNPIKKIKLPRAYHVNGFPLKGLNLLKKKNQDVVIDNSEIRFHLYLDNLIPINSILETINSP